MPPFSEFLYNKKKKALMEEEIEGRRELSNSIPRGGPIYVPNLVGPLSSVPNFESSLLLQLQVLSLSKINKAIIFFFNFFFYKFVFVDWLCISSMQNLEAELCTSDSSQPLDEDISYVLFFFFPLYRILNSLLFN